MISVDRALEIVLEHTPALPAEETPLYAGARPCPRRRRRHRPRLPALRPLGHGRLRGPRAGHGPGPATLAVVGEVRAGQWPTRTLGAGEAISDHDGRSPAPGRRRGPAGRADPPAQRGPAWRCWPRSSPARMSRPGAPRSAPASASSSAGDGSIPPRSRCWRRWGGPRSGWERGRGSVLATGDELVEVGPKLRMAPRSATATASRPWPRRTRRVPWAAPWASCRTTRAASRRRVSDGLAGDVLVLSGGVSAGVYDLVEEVLTQLRRGDPVRQGRHQARRAPGLWSPPAFGRGGAAGPPGDDAGLRPARQPRVRPGHLRPVRARGPPAHAGGAWRPRPTVEVELAGGARNRSGRRAHLPAPRPVHGGAARGRAPALARLRRPRGPCPGQRPRGARGFTHRRRARRAGARPPALHLPGAWHGA